MAPAQSPSSPPPPRLSVVILNYNGAPWLERCLNSLRAQTIFDQLQVMLADNSSSDNSAQLGEPIVESWPGSGFLPHGQNLG